MGTSFKARAACAALALFAGGLVASVPFALVTATPASAATITPGTSDDEVPPTANGSCTLREAILDANGVAANDDCGLLGAASQPDVIDLTGLQTISMSGALALPPITDTVEIIGGGPGGDVPLPNTLTIDANDTQIFTVTDPNAVLTIAGMRLLDGNANGSGGSISSPGAVVLTDVVIESSTANGTGGAVAAGTVEVVDSTFKDNTLAGGTTEGGAAIVTYSGAVNATGDATVTVSGDPVFASPGVSAVPNVESVIVTSTTPLSSPDPLALIAPPLASVDALRRNVAPVTSTRFPAAPVSSARQPPLLPEELSVNCAPPPRTTI